MEEARIQCVQRGISMYIHETALGSTQYLDPDAIVNVNGAARLLGVSASWLNKLRSRSSDDCPPYIRAGRRVFYRIVDLRAWQADRIAMPGR